MVSSGLGPTKSYLTSPSLRLSSVSRMVSSSLKYLVVESQVARPRLSVVSATFEVTCFLINKEAALVLVRLLRN